MSEHHDAMLAAGWIARRNLQGEVVEWQDPTEPRHIWPEWEAATFYSVGDMPGVPRIRYREEAELLATPSLFPLVDVERGEVP